MGRLATRTDPLGRVEYFSYDLQGHPAQWVDRKGQVTLRGYDGLDRLHTITYDDGATISYTYNDRDRITQIADTASGAIGRGYDDLDRLTTETTLQGTVSYTYDAADRRETMTVAGQPDVVYSYDDADRLTGLTRDTLGVALAYDDANRRTSLTLPNGIVTAYRVRRRQSAHQPHVPEWADNARRPDVHVRSGGPAGGGRRELGAHPAAAAGRDRQLRRCERADRLGRPADGVRPEWESDV